MTVVLLAVGSRGDILPHVTLARHLSGAGHEVVLATTDEQRHLADGSGVPVVSLAPGVRFWSTGTVADEGRRSRFENPLGALIELRSLMRELARPMAGVLDDLVEPGDVVLHGVLGAGAAVGLAVTRGCRLAQVTFAATVPTAYGGSYISAPLSTTRSRVNLVASRAAHRFFMGITTAPGTVIANRHGQRLDGALVDRQVLANPTLIATSALLASPAPDWPDRVAVTGAWSAAAGSDPGNAGQSGAVPSGAVLSGLQDFLAAGPAPVYVGFGSAVARDPIGDLRIFTAAAGRAGVRAVLRPSDWLGDAVLPDLGRHVAVVGTVPHEWLFPRMAAVVHHGGAGTTIAALSARVPSSVVWHNVDQPFHARRCAALGVGPLGFPKAKLRADRLAALFSQLTGPEAGRFQASASRAADLVSGEDGPAAALRALQTWGYL